MAQGNLKLKSKKAARVTKKQLNPKKAAPKIIKAKNPQLKKPKNLLKFINHN